MKYEFIGIGYEQRQISSSIKDVNGLILLDIYKRNKDGVIIYKQWRSVIESNQLQDIFNTINELRRVGYLSVNEVLLNYRKSNEASNEK